MSRKRDPLPEAMKRGRPPTARKARTGLDTPPGMMASARRKASADRGVWSFFGSVGTAASG